VLNERKLKIAMKKNSLLSLNSDTPSVRPFCTLLVLSPILYIM